MNGILGDKIFRARGLHQGDPLSPLLFLLVMEVLGTLIRRADDWSLLQLLGARLPHRASFYADDLVLFILPSTLDLHMVCCILTCSKTPRAWGATWPNVK
jgi:hypothetical protein